MDELSAYALIALSAFLSATLLPGSSEAVLIGLLAAGNGEPATLVLIASVGNVTGAAVNWTIGRFLAQYEGRRWFPVDPDRARKARQWFDRYGVWSLLVSWLPVVGDPLTVIAGLARVGFWRFLLLVSAGKAGRYAMIASAWLHWPFP
ncbi:YqaA family protein [Defluviimonas salinarum]|uniref:DedA family protein n=1 Tax=Defluviimonas salinarum TaxID=2992147 RepID=A0ABT3J598_9RHOB|nr:DedA family protein [Defluviimonas salinarum]